MFTKIKNEIDAHSKELGSCTTECREFKRNDIYGLYGSLFFLGMFLGLLFTMATVLIIYYKQISEGYEDKKRFEIMQKVGMSNQEVKSSIRSQVLTVFFLPLITAGIHVAVAFPIIRKILLMLSLTNTKLYVICTMSSFDIWFYISSYCKGLLQNSEKIAEKKCFLFIGSIFYCFYRKQNMVSPYSGLTTAFY